jgi:GTP-binding protein HflX
MGVDNGKLMAFLARHGEILSKTFQDLHVTMHCRLPQKFLGRINDPDVVIREIDMKTVADEHSNEPTTPSVEDVA